MACGGGGDRRGLRHQGQQPRGRPPRQRGWIRDALRGRLPPRGTPSRSAPGLRRKLLRDRRARTALHADARHATVSHAGPLFRRRTKDLAGVQRGNAPLCGRGRPQRPHGRARRVAHLLDSLRSGSAGRLGVRPSRHRGPPSPPHPPLRPRAPGPGRRRRTARDARRTARQHGRRHPSSSTGGGGSSRPTNAPRRTSGTAPG